MTESNRNTFKIEEIIYYLFFAFFLTVKGLGFYEGQKVYTLALVIAAVLVVAKLLVSEYTPAEWIFNIAMISLSFLIYFSSGEIGPFIIMAVVLGMKNVSVKRIMIIGALVWTVTMTVSMLLVLLGLRSDIVRVQEKLGLTHIIRYSLGSTHPNVLQISTMLLCAFWLYYLKPKGRNLYIMSLMMLVINVYVFIYSLSYTGFALALLFVALNIYVTKRKKFSKFEQAVFYCLVPLCAVFMVVGPNVLPSPYFDIINKLLNTRYNITRTFMACNPIKIFGTGYCNELPVAANNLDSSYVYALMHYGVIFLVLMIAAFIGLIAYFVKTDKRIELGITLSLVIAAVSEPFFVNTSFKNICWVFLGEFVYYEFGKLKNQKTFSLIKVGSREVNIPVDSFMNRLDAFGAKLKNSCVKKTVISVIAGIVIAFVCSFLVTKTEVFYINRTLVQMDDEEYVTIDINNLPAGDEDAVIINYVDDKTPMQRLTEDIVWVEYYRKLLSIAVWSGLVIYILISCHKSEGEQRVQ